MTLRVLEVLSYAALPLSWYFFKRFANRDIAGELIAGTLLGTFIEFSTAPQLQYHFALTFYKHVPPSIPMAWGLMFSLAAFLGEKLYLLALRTDAVNTQDKRIMPCDMLAGIAVGLPLETLGCKAGVWDYNFQVLGWNWGQIPIFHMPYEALAGYALVMLVGPSLVRHWRVGLSPLAWVSAR